MKMKRNSYKGQTSSRLERSALIRKHVMNGTDRFLSLNKVKKLKQMINKTKLKQAFKQVSNLKLPIMRGVLRSWLNQ